MAVYREGYAIIEDIQKNSERVFNDACDYGAPVKKGDARWNAVQQLIEWYGKEWDYKTEDEKAFPVVRTNDSTATKVKLIDEWALSDKRKTDSEATDLYIVEYMKLDSFKNKPYLNSKFKDCDGFVSVYKIN